MSKKHAASKKTEAKKTETKITSFAEFKEKFGIDKKKLLSSLLVGFTVPFVFLICSVFSVFFSNAEEFDFGIADFAPTFILASLGVFVIITVALLLTKGTLRNSIFTVCAGVTVCGYIQSMVTTMTFKGLPGDGNANIPADWAIILNFTVWVLLLTAAIWYGILSEKAQFGRTVLSFLLILVLVMQTVSIVPAAITYASEEAEKSDLSTPQNTSSYLNTAGMFELSTKDNVIVFILDRFDRIYYNELINYDKDFFKDFDGFTYYNDNISKYPRTYPAVTSMLTGMNNDYSGSRTDYFRKAYGNSTFLPDMKNNNYKINLYIPSYYGYDNANVFGDLVANTSAAEGYTISSYGELTKELVQLSSYFWLPDLLKSRTVSSNSFSSIVNVTGEAPEYTMDTTSDPAVYDEFEKTGIRTQNKENTFTFLHLRGCHSPYTMDENCNPVAENSVGSLQQTRGCFKLISEYIQQMKKLGIYKNATIIITGDHATLDSDSAEYTNENLTALLVKEKGSVGTEMKVSNAQVSQDNFLATIIKSAGIKTSHDYGMAYSEVPEGVDQTRTHYFQIYTGSDKKDENLTYEITGPGTNFGNWKITNREQIGYIYK